MPPSSREAGVAECEHAAVGRNGPVAAAARGRGDADERGIQAHPGGGAERGALRRRRGRCWRTGRRPARRPWSRTPPRPQTRDRSRRRAARCPRNAAAACGMGDGWSRDVRWYADGRARGRRLRARALSWSFGSPPCGEHRGGAGRTVSRRGDGGGRSTTVGGPPADPTAAGLPAGTPLVRSDHGQELPVQGPERRLRRTPRPALVGPRHFHVQAVVRVQTVIKGRSGVPPKRTLPSAHRGIRDGE